MKNAMFLKMKNSNNFFSVLAVLFVLLTIASCSKDDDGSGPGGPMGLAVTDTITDDISERTILKNLGEGVDYYVCGSIGVSNELIIEPGVNIVMCSEAGFYVKENGAFNAVGTTDAPISIVGEVNSPGYWNYIGIDSNDPTNVLKNVTIKNGGGDSYPVDYSSIYVEDGAQLTIDNSIISDSKQYGVLVARGGALPNFTSNTFSNNGGAGIKIPFSIIGSMDDASNYMDGNEKNYIYVYKASLNQEQSAKVASAPYYIEGNSNIVEGLTLNPGVIFLMGPEAGFYVKPSGYINAIGTATDKIIIKGAVESVGYWDYIGIESNNPKNEFAYVEVSNGGADSYPVDYASIYVGGNRSFTMNNCSVSDSYGWGLFVQNGANISPDSVAGMQSANTFMNNGTGGDANCTGSCDVRMD